MQFYSIITLLEPTCNDKTVKLQQQISAINNSKHPFKLTVTLQTNAKLHKSPSY